MADEKTLRFYADNAAVYAEHSKQPSVELAGFLSRLPQGGAVLELGTGNGRDAAAMLAAGFAVTPSDASPELAAQAEARLGHAVRIMAFHELSDVKAYDGIWACAALLHAPRDELTPDFTRILCALRPGGYLGASFKAGQDEGRDALGRYYNYLSADELAAHLTNSGLWTDVTTTERDGSGYDGQPTRWLWLSARRPL